MELSSLGRYEIRGELGRGTMGVVYRGYDPVIGRPVALKTVLLPESFSADQRNAFLHRFFLEARIAGKLIHPNIVITYDAATDEQTKTPFMVMELVEGEPLNRRIEKQGRLEWRQAIEIVIPLAQALDYAHQQQGIVHRDIKPANVLLTQNAVPKIADFGIAKLPKADLTQTGVVMGTPYYMSPEQLLGEKKLDGRSDLFSLGAVLYTLLVGKPPFDAAELTAISYQVLHKDPVPPSEILSEIPAALDGVLARALTKTAAERYPDGRAFAEDLRSVERGQSPRLALAPGVRTEIHEPKRVTTSKAPPSLELPGEPPGRRSFGRLLILTVLIVGALFFEGMIGSDELSQRMSALLEPLQGLSTQAGELWDKVSGAYQESRAEQEQMTRLQDKARALQQEGEELERRGLWQQARAAYEESLETSRTAEDGIGEASALLARGRLESQLGNGSRARADLDAAAAVYRIYAHPAGEIKARILLGNLERDGGKAARAESLYGEALYLAEKMEAPQLRSEVRLNKAILELMQGRWGSAQAALLLVAKMAPGEELSRSALPWLGAAAYTTGSREIAFAWWAEARRICQEAQDSECLAQVRLWEGRAAFHEGDLPQARSHFQEAEKTFREGPHLPGLAAAVESLAELALTDKDVAAAEQELAELAEIRGRLGLPEWEPASQVDKADLRWERFSFLLRALPRTALSEQRLAQVARAP